MQRRRTGLLLWTLAPPAIVNVALNLWWIPLFGAMGAVYSTVVAFAVGLALSVSIGRRIFAMPLPLGPLWRPMVATLAMAAALLLMPRAQGLPALLLLILFGMLVYGIAALLLDVVGIRSRVLALAAAWR